MLKVVFTLLCCFVFILCKTTVSTEKALSYKDTKGIYYYGWMGENDYFCIGRCNTKPTSQEAALTKECNNGVKYYENGNMDVLYNYFISSTNKNLAHILIV